MTGEDLKEALLSGIPVIYNDIVNGDIECKCVCAIVYTNNNGKIRCSAELLDNNLKGHYSCSPERIRFIEEK
ncbi:MAG: hypothetical protein E7593_05355 [Ruminococcaceae bacterium]|nr:hypothetical protein [Oscillospiraceae bacterium]